MTTSFPTGPTSVARIHVQIPQAVATVVLPVAGPPGPGGGGGGSALHLNGPSNPEGVVTADKGAILSTVGAYGGRVYIKRRGNGTNDGWVQAIDQEDLDYTVSGLGGGGGGSELHLSGEGNPNGVAVAPPGAIYSRLAYADPNERLYVKMWGEEADGWYSVANMETVISLLPNMSDVWARLDALETGGGGGSGLHLFGDVPPEGNVAAPVGAVYSYPGDAAESWHFFIKDGDPDGPNAWHAVATQHDITNVFASLGILAERVLGGELPVGEFPNGPEGQVYAAPGTLFCEGSDPGALYYKVSGTLDTGWKKVVLEDI